MGMVEVARLAASATTLPPTLIKAGLSRTSSSEEELHSILGLERRNRVRLLARQAQELAAGDNLQEVRARGRELGEAGCRLDEMLEVVEQKEQALVGDVLGQPVPRPKRLRSLLEHEPRVA